MARRLRRPSQNFLVLALAIVAAIAILLAYFLFHISQQDQIWSNLTAEVVAGLFIAVAAFFLGRYGISLNSMQSEQSTGAVVSFYPEHAEVDWTTIIGSAKRIDIVVHYYGRWVRTNHKAFVDFFQRGGELRIAMADPAIPGVLATVQSNFFSGLTRKELSQKIASTEERLKDAFNEAGSQKARLTTFYFPQALHYSFVLVNSRFLYLSVYEQFRGPNVRSSVFGIDLTKDQALEEYWLANRQAFFEGSRVGLDL